MQLGSPNSTYICSTMSPGNPFILGSKGQRWRSPVSAWVSRLITPSTSLFSPHTAEWRLDFSVSDVDCIDEVTLRWARLVPRYGWPFADIGLPFSVCNQPLRPTQPPTLSWMENEYPPRGSGIVCSAAGKVTVGLSSHILCKAYYNYLRSQRPVWLNGKAFARDSKGRGFESRPVRFQVTALGKLLTCMCLCHQAV